MVERSKCQKQCSPFLSFWSAIFFLLAIATLDKLGLAQAPGTASPSFDVASVRPSHECAGFFMSPPGSRSFSVRNASMAFLIGMAYRVGNDQIEKNPSWIDSECYVISARAEGDGDLGNDQLRLLLQNLLSQRFHLSLHREMKDFSGYALVVAKDGPKLDATKGVTVPGYIGRDGLRVRNTSTGALATMLVHTVGAHVVDKTGLTGRYDINLSFAPNASLATTDSSLPSIFTAVQEQLGLKLIPEKVPVEMLVVDHVEKVPTEN
jgi:uncharacterized protein (TIGR03435 family)